MDETNDIGFYKYPLKTKMFFEWYFRILQSLQETPHFPPDLPGRRTYDCGGFYSVDHLLQGLQVRVLVSKLLLLVVKVASSLNLWKKKYFSPHKIPHGSMLNTWGYLWRPSQWQTHSLPSQWDLLSPPSRFSWQLPLSSAPLWPWPL